MRFIYSLILLIVGQVVFAQNKTLTIQDAIRGYHLYPSNLSQLQWMPSGNWFSQVITDDNEQILMLTEIEETHNGRVLKVSLKDINTALKKAGKDTLSSMPYARWITDNQFGFPQGKEFLAYTIDSKKITRRFGMNDKASSIIYANDYKGYAGVIDKGFAYEANGVFGSRTSTEKGRVLGDAVHRSEFGITNGLFFSPNATRLAYYDMMENMVTEYPLYNLNDTPASVKEIRYPTAGKLSHHVSIYLRSLDVNGDFFRLKTGTPDEHYLTNVSWTPDDKYVLVAELPRSQDKMQLNMYDASTGEYVRTLLSESNERYVEPEHPAVFLKTDPTKFVWWSERDGFNHLYLYDLQGELIKQLTKGNWEVTDFHGFSKDGSMLYITANAESPLNRDLYCVNVKTGKMKKLTTGDGYHSIIANNNNSLFIDYYSSPTVPRKIRIIDHEGVLIENLHESENPLEDYKLGDMEIGKLKGSGGQDLYYRVFKPINFDPSKKYPVVVYLYNGPHVQLVTNSWLGGANLWYQYMAQNGFVVFTIDGRGSANRGFDFESTIHRNLAEKEMDDQMVGVNWLKSQSWVDHDRLGIHGWSYGGYMTINMMTRQDSVFKAGVAGGPVIDWSLYEVMYTERYMDSPQENPEGYKNTNLKNYVSNLDGKLLIIHGAQDNVVLWQHSLQYLEAAIKANKQLDYFVYPSHEHNVYGQDRVHLFDKISNYFFDNL